MSDIGYLMMMDLNLGEAMIVSFDRYTVESKYSSIEDFAIEVMADCNYDPSATSWMESNHPINITFKQD